MLNKKVAGKYRAVKKIGSGAFGEIFLATDSSGREFAMKLERLSSHHPQLIYESKLLKTFQGAPGIPLIIWSGLESNFSVMIIELLGPNLEELLTTCNRQFSLKTTLMLADQMLTRIEHIHSKSFIHRDLKPENFLIGIGKTSSLLYLIDFGLAKKYRDPKSLKHIDYKEGKYLTGTARYASINTHLGIDQSRRDDLESIGYILLYLLRGSLPWQGIVADNRNEKHRGIMDKKIGLSLEQLCSEVPEEFRVYLGYCRGLKFDESPDYSYLRRLFKGLFINQGFDNDCVYQWMVNKHLGHRKQKSAAVRGELIRDDDEDETRSEKGRNKKCNIF